MTAGQEHSRISAEVSRRFKTVDQAAGKAPRSDFLRGYLAALAGLGMWLDYSGPETSHQDRKVA